MNIEVRLENGNWITPDWIGYDPQKKEWRCRYMEPGGYDDMKLEKGLIYVGIGSTLEEALAELAGGYLTEEVA